MRSGCTRSAALARRPIPRGAVATAVLARNQVVNRLDHVGPPIRRSRTYVTRSTAGSPDAGSQKGSRRRQAVTDAGRRPATIGAGNGLSGDGQRRSTTARLRLVSGRSAVRIRSPAPRRYLQRHPLSCGNLGLLRVRSHAVTCSATSCRGHRSPSVAARRLHGVRRAIWIQTVGTAQEGLCVLHMPVLRVSGHVGQRTGAGANSGKSFRRGVPAGSPGVDARGHAGCCAP